MPVSDNPLRGYRLRVPRRHKKKARAELTARACYPLGAAISPAGLGAGRCYRQGREPVGNGQAAAGFSDDLMPGAAAVEGAAAAAGFAAGFAAAFFAGALAATFAAGFAAGFTSVFAFVAVLAKCMTSKNA